jgi:hypothetical protein
MFSSTAASATRLHAGLRPCEDGSRTGHGAGQEVRILGLEDLVTATRHGWVLGQCGTQSVLILPAAYTFTAADAGVHTFSGGLTLITPGNQTITATDTASGMTRTVTVTILPPN